MNDEKVPDLRQQIDRVDGELLSLLARRRALSLEVARSKDRSGREIRDAEREEELLLELIRRGREQGLDAPFVTRVYHEILEDSVRRQQRFVQDRVNEQEVESERVRVACFGESSSYSHLAARQHFAWLGDRMRPVPCRSFRAILAAVEAGQADFGLLPIENTTSGSINEVYDLLMHTRLRLVGETQLRVRHCLGGCADTPLPELRRIYSHPQALAQCGRFLRSLEDCHIEVENSTASAARRVKEEADPTRAAVASEEALRAHGLVVLKRDVADHPENTTRFVVVAREAIQVDARVPSKTSLVMATGQRAGALVDALLVLRDRGLAMTKLESRPVPDNPFEELFYVDVEGNPAEERWGDALEALRRVTRFVRVLGSYPSGQHDATRPSPEKLHAAPTSPTRDPAPALVRVGSLEFGAGPPVVLAQPEVSVAARSADEFARRAQDAGVHLLLEPAHSGSSSDRSAWAQAARRFQLAFGVRSREAGQVLADARIGDVLWISGEHFGDDDLHDAAGRVLRPVLLARASNEEVDAWLQRAERIRLAGNQQVVLVEGTQPGPALDLPALIRLRRDGALPLVAAPGGWSEDWREWSELAGALRGAGAAGLVVPMAAEPGAGHVGYADAVALLREFFRA